MESISLTSCVTVGKVRNKHIQSLSVVVIVFMLSKYNGGISLQLLKSMIENSSINIIITGYVSVYILIKKLYASVIIITVTYKKHVTIF